LELLREELEKGNYPFIGGPLYGKGYIGLGIKAKALKVWELGKFCLATQFQEG